MTNQDGCVTITNLATGEERTFTLTVEEALISANEYDKMNRNTWTYPKPENVVFDISTIERKFGKAIALGDWAGWKVTK